ncbi:porin family protein [Flavobacterium sp.]|uniref:porin family protein n=1 Tax=Flavobacterium sp. TaxID=239 RepID=UPI00261099B4|nr:porin family protein [Flavobacterium sp.]
MKVLKIVLLGMCVAAAIPSAQAQKFGVRAGLTIANVSGDGFGSDVKPLTGVYAGVFKEITIVPELFFLEPEVQYSMQGFKTNDTNYSIGYINVPVLAKVYILKTLSLEAGPQVGFKINDNFPDSAGDDTKIETIDTAIAGGIGLNFPIGLSINARYAMGLSDIVKDVDGKNQVIQVGAAFKF